ncbi:hypothetical protein J6590_069181 [Homalodisca vitripennis]|nr:hypothetical protein J6590_069181 [Homalodisca vitripennis]
MTLPTGRNSNEADSLRSCLLACLEERCLDLHVSFKDKSVACCQLKDQYDVDISNLNNLLAKSREENTALKEWLDLMPKHNSNIIQGSQTKVEALVAERRPLLTTVEVLEAEIKCLRGELRGRRERANL